MSILEPAALAATITSDDLRSRLDDPALTIVDVRPIAAYNGWRLAGEPRGGHIPGAKAFPAAWLGSVDQPEIARLLWFERWVLDEDVVIGGLALPPGSRVALVIGAANRDPRRFTEPDRFDIRRADAAHLSFGGGIHFCIGAPLARLELETTLSELLRTEAELQVLPGAARRPTFQFRGWARLPIAIHP